MKRYAIVSSDLETITLTDSSSHSPLRDSVIVDYSLSKDLKVLKGKLVQFVFYHRTYNDVDDETVTADSFIVRKFLLWTWMAKKNGWLEVKEREKVVLKNPKGFKVIEVNGK